MDHHVLSHYAYFLHCVSMKIKLRPSGADTWALLIFIFASESRFDRRAFKEGDSSGLI
jgi:hypothetical protein